jgi:hypothetical protein
VRLALRRTVCELVALEPAARDVVKTFRVAEADESLAGEGLEGGEVFG